MKKVLVLYWSGTGNTEAMANAIGEGAKAAGSEVDVVAVCDFDKSTVGSYDSVALGCPAMGAETLEESEFEPMYDDTKGELGGKTVALFGSYGWGDGEWMRTWEDDCKASGITLAFESLLINEAPDDAGIEKCKAFGSKLA